MENLLWKDKVDGQDDILAEDINSIANYANELNGGKVDKVDGKGLSTNDYTNADKSKVAIAITGNDLDKRIKYVAQDCDMDEEFLKNITEEGIYSVDFYYDGIDDTAYALLIVSSSYHSDVEAKFLYQTLYEFNTCIQREAYYDENGELGEWSDWTEVYTTPLYVTNQLKSYAKTSELDKRIKYIPYYYWGKNDEGYYNRVDYDDDIFREMGIYHITAFMDGDESYMQLSTVLLFVDKPCDYITQYRIENGKIYTRHDTEDSWSDWTEVYANASDVSALSKKVDALETDIGDIETALDSIIAIQTELIGGDAE